MAPQLDIVIPVYNEGQNILATLAALAREVKTTARVLIVYDRPDDDTLPAIRNNPEAYTGIPVEFVRNPGRGAHQAVMTKRVVHDRSVVMAFRMQRELRRGNAFVALGALHLYGEKGVLALLEEDGYRARAVY